MATTPVQDIQEVFMSTVRKGQETVIDAIKTWTETVQSVTPKFPALPFSASQVPFSGLLPSPKEVVASAYDFAEALLASQRTFAEDVLKATAPLLPGEFKTSAEQEAE
jgi:hypothetical protein